MDLHLRHRHVNGPAVRTSRKDRSCHPNRSGDPAQRAAHRASMRARFDALSGQQPLLRVDGLVAGYGLTEILHGVDLRLSKGQALCIIGPNGAGKSTILHSIFGLTDIREGRIEVGGRNVTRLGTNEKLRDAGIACVLRHSSLFPDMTVEQNLWLAGYLTRRREEATQAAEKVFDRYPELALRRHHPARVLSAGERRLVEISRALVMQPRLLLVDEPAIGLEPLFVEQVFGMLRDLRDREGLTILMVEQNAKKALELADIGCVVVAGEIEMAGTGAELLDDPTVGRLFLDG